MRLKAPILLFALSASALLWRCGSDKDEKKANPTPPIDSSGVPSDWDGKSDYSGSAFQMVDE